MLLVIPAIEIKGGKCVQMVQGHEGFVYSDDPIEMAKLWRKENAKSLHVTDVDGALAGRLVNFDVIERMVKTVDIPIELGGGLRTFEEVKRAFDAGVYRVLVSTMLIDNPGEAKRIVDVFGASKVVLGIDAENGIVMTRGWKKDSGLTAISVALNAKALGFKRVVYTDITVDGTMRGANLSAIRELAQKTGMRVTASGGLSGFSDLLRLQEFEQYGVDSVVIGRALYANKFSCQELWRICESGDFPYTARI
ncbi:MAG: 1-(5-phosphoribosyl)-5-[(5-phosphoribosylamino)methylideneamino]imidazole-4-carboxamide isomerase [Ignavibacteriae bacterium]|nr:1-(5-phosphoribosyl)-5-[(5-phosphoribosylamino)methylideneamino]imidazole-4-carboxamide isomerase [Ignavibacteria bacterium]MBI3364135.1 1-(5-phosphoribosyl)-5-[(5-phosphoribosylamino)methylideneamino]imidazole-4-carboxamide isomerase [Ignavibacteriota bacterium]